MIFPKLLVDSQVFERRSTVMAAVGWGAAFSSHCLTCCAVDHPPLPLCNISTTLRQLKSNKLLLTLNDMLSSKPCPLLFLDPFSCVSARWSSVPDSVLFHIGPVPHPGPGHPWKRSERTPSGAVTPDGCTTPPIQQPEASRQVGPVEGRSGDQTASSGRQSFIRASNLGHWATKSGGRHTRKRSSTPAQYL